MYTYETCIEIYCTDILCNIYIHTYIIYMSWQVVSICSTTSGVRIPQPIPEVVDAEVDRERGRINIVMEVQPVVTSNGRAGEVFFSPVQKRGGLFEMGSFLLFLHFKIFE